MSRRKYYFRESAIYIDPKVTLLKVLLMKEYEQHYKELMEQQGE